jgi:hypothetical protein
MLSTRLRRCSLPMRRCASVANLLSLTTEKLRKIEMSCAVFSMRAQIISTACGAAARAAATRCPSPLSCRQRCLRSSCRQKRVLRLSDRIAHQICLKVPHRQYLCKIADFDPEEEAPPAM